MFCCAVETYCSGNSCLYMYTLPKLRKPGFTNIQVKHGSSCLRYICLNRTHMTPKSLWCHMSGSATSIYSSRFLQKAEKHTDSPNMAQHASWGLQLRWSFHQIQKKKILFNCGDFLGRGMFRLNPRQAKAWPYGSIQMHMKEVGGGFTSCLLEQKLSTCLKDNHNPKCQWLQAACEVGKP